MISSNKVVKGIVIGLAIGLLWDVGNKFAPNLFT